MIETEQINEPEETPDTEAGETTLPSAELQVDTEPMPDEKGDDQKITQQSEGDDNLELPESEQSEPDHPDVLQGESTEKSLEPVQESKPKLDPKEVQRRLGLLVNDFAACGRCSYFLTGYRVVHGEEGMETAVSTQKGKWLKLAWNHPMRELISKSYGVQLYVDFFHYDGCCSECGRRFTLKTAEKNGEQTKKLRIGITD